MRDMDDKQQSRILLVEDDESLGFVVRDNLQDLGYYVRLEVDGEEGLKAYRKERFDLLILDVMMPRMDGITMAREIRKTDEVTPIVFLTARDAKEDKITGFRSGADDYITKPFSVEELVLRLEAVLKRYRLSSPESARKQSFKFGDVVFDNDNLTLKVGKGSHQLTQKEAAVMYMFCVSPNQVLKRGMILKEVWGTDDYFLGRSLDVFITKLRKYLKGARDVKIENIHGVGFRMNYGGKQDG